jgi:hypothetical protein
MSLMMMKTNPITPPLELMQQWAAEYWNDPGEPIGNGEKYIAIQAAQWGADQELEACCKWIPIATPWDEEQLRAARRPKPPSLKEQALADLDSMSIEPCWINGIDANALVRAKYDNIRRALEALDD